MLTDLDTFDFTLASKVTGGYYLHILMGQAVCYQCATDIEKALSEAATSEEKYYQLLCGNMHQISKELEKTRKKKRG